MNDKQETYYSCGAFALKKVLWAFGKKITERRVREICNTTLNGTDQAGLEAGLNYWGLHYAVVKIKSKQIFKEKIKSQLKKQCAIILVDNCAHWVACTGIENRKFTVYDSDFARVKQHLTLSQLTRLASNYDKLTNQEYFLYFLIGGK